MEKTIGFGTMIKERKNGLTKIGIRGYTGHTLYKEAYGDITADDVVAAYQGKGDNREYGESFIADIYSPKDADYYPTFCGAYLDDGSFIIADNFVGLRAKAKAEGRYLRQAYVVRKGFWKEHSHDTYQQFLAALWDQETLAMRPMTYEDLWAHLPKEDA
jgi:hypothetical protein